MWYFVVCYFSWPMAFFIWGLNRWQKGKVKGLYFIVSGSILELFAFFIHWRDWYRLSGKPDQLYVWILPALLSIIALGLLMAGIVRSFFIVRVGDLEVTNDHVDVTSQ